MVNNKTGKAARRLATIGLPLILFLALAVGWSVGADEPSPSTDGALVLYEIRVAGGGLDRWEVVVPQGFEYVGLAATSDVGVEPEIADGGERLVWNGPFSDAQVLRFWLAPATAVEAPAALRILGTDLEALRVEPVAPSPGGRETSPASSDLAGTVTVSKEVEPDEIEPGDSLWVTYEVVFLHEDPGAVTLDRITDTLPTDFVFGGMAYGSDVITAPIDAGNSQYVWESVTFSDELTMRYNVRAVERAGEYQNSVVALAGGEQIGPASAPLSVVGFHRLSLPMMYKNLRVPMPLWQITKVGGPLEVETGEPVNYSVEIRNVGDATGTLGTIWDFTPADFTFVQMLSGSEVTFPPTVRDGWLEWWSEDDPWEIAPGENLVLYYQMQSGGEGAKTNRVEVYTVGGRLVGTASATVNVLPGAPLWQITKAADPLEVETGEPVNYSVEIRNVGDATGTLGTIWDFTPAGFSFVQMLPGSEVTFPPTVTDGRLEWWSEDAPWEVAPGENLVVYYQVQSGGEGAKTNRVEVYAVGGGLVGSDSATVNVLSGAPLPFEDDFSNGVSPDWQPFLNWPGLSANRWYWTGELGSWGIYNYDSLRVLPENTSYDLSMYNATGAQNWTDYRIETRMKDVKDHNLDRGVTGIWFRGTYEDSGLMDGKTVGGYYFYMKPADDHLYLGRIRPADSAFYSWDLVGSYYYAPRVGRKHWYDVIIEVQGARIQVWFGDEVDGIIKVFDWTDPQAAWPNGTVGFAVYFTASRYDYMRVLPLD